MDPTNPPNVAITACSASFILSITEGVFASVGRDAALISEYAKANENTIKTNSASKWRNSLIILNMNSENAIERALLPDEISFPKRPQQKIQANHCSSPVKA